MSIDYPLRSAWARHQQVNKKAAGLLFSSEDLLHNREKYFLILQQYAAACSQKKQIGYPPESCLVNPAVNLIACPQRQCQRNQA